MEARRARGGKPVVGLRCVAVSYERPPGSWGRISVTSVGGISDIVFFSFVYQKNFVIFVP